MSQEAMEIAMRNSMENRGAPAGGIPPGFDVLSEINDFNMRMRAMQQLQREGMLRPPMGYIPIAERNPIVVPSHPIPTARPTRVLTQAERRLLQDMDIKLQEGHNYNDYYHN